MKDLNTSIQVTNQGFPVVDSLVLELCNWAVKASPGKWLVKVYQDLTKEQRGYLHASIIPHYIKIQNELGSIITPEDAKEDLKKRFLGYKITEFSDKEGKKHKVKVLRSTESLSKEEYSEFIDKVCNWFIDYFGMPAPEPRGNK